MIMVILDIDLHLPDTDINKLSLQLFQWNSNRNRQAKYIKCNTTKLKSSGGKTSKFTFCLKKAICDANY